MVTGATFALPRRLAGFGASSAGNDAGFALFPVGCELSPSSFDWLSPRIFTPTGNPLLWVFSMGAVGFPLAVVEGTICPQLMQNCWSWMEIICFEWQFGQTISIIKPRSLVSLNGLFCQKSLAVCTTDTADEVLDFPRLSNSSPVFLCTIIKNGVPLLLECPILVVQQVWLLVRAYSELPC